MKKTIYFLLLCVAGLMYSCSEDEEVHKHDHHEKSQAGYKRSLISFEDMKSKLLPTYGKSLSLFSDLANKGGEDYIQEIDTTYIIQYSNDTLTTYTMRVSTQDDDNYSYSNLIIRTINGETEEFVAHYSPSEAWQTAHNNGEYLPYEGTLHLTNSEGVSILDENEEGAQGKATVCYFALESEHTECYGATCPCTDGNGTTNYNITLVCTGSAGGGGSPPDYGDPGNGGGGGGSGDSGSGGNGPDLPTDPT